MALTAKSRLSSANDSEDTVQAVNPLEDPKDFMNVSIQIFGVTSGKAGNPQGRWNSPLA
ncbi:hypothetical protein [Wenzhouxiangella marina]|uniref:hypothetical protein n=1 Tax=Wenzhouxiangella marina TaxID=1579979 RepID=UPI0014700A8C|nr:hypothetical protein [Wenzhouxiangella marina]MBB6088571.1 hypothetical protein [Wenzhouxiangella marina]